MHIPDNYLSPTTCVALGVAMLPVWTIAVKKVKHELSKVKMPMLGIGAAFSFIIMMFNIPLPGGTTGHAVGGTLIAILLGPFSACISVSVALLIQALMFGDGGIISFAANCFNMAFILPFTGYYIYKVIQLILNKFSKSKEEGIQNSFFQNIGVAIGAYVGLNAAALFTAIEFGIQPILFKSASGQPLYAPYDLSISIPAMMIPHLLVAGVLEAAFTVAVIIFIKRVSPGTLYEGKKEKTKPIYLMLIGLICISPLGLLAAGTAWGEWSSEEIKDIVQNEKILGFVPDGMKNGFNFKALMPDYTILGLPDFAAYILAAIAGVSILVIIFKLVGEVKIKK